MTDKLDLPFKCNMCTASYLHHTNLCRHKKQKHATESQFDLTINELHGMLLKLMTITVQNLPEKLKNEGKEIDFIDASHSLISPKWIEVLRIVNEMSVMGKRFQLLSSTDVSIEQYFAKEDLVNRQRKC